MKGHRLMINKNVIISVKGLQASIDQEINEIELVTEGKYYRKGDTYYISYKESQVTGMEGTTTTLKVVDGIVTLLRFGLVNTQFVFELGRKHSCYYDTSYGAFTIGIFTNTIDIDVGESGGEIKVGYEIEIDNNKSGEIDFHMMIREAGNNNDQHSSGCN